ncbi:MAG: MipA/OmpV family protein [Alphaproteobacteria bacterium]|nr:MipA/OmpV family protein [Alphaproteobacteria bacterium]
MRWGQYASWLGALWLLVAGVASTAAADVLPPDIEARIVQVARLPSAPAVSAMVIELIAAHPDLVYPITLRATRAAPAYSSEIVRDATRAFPGFASEIAEAAGTATPEQALVIADLAAASSGTSARSLRETMENNPSIGTRTASPWRVSLGLGLGWANEYEGADNYRFLALPLVDVTWRDTLFLRTDGGLTETVTGLGPTGLGANLWRTPNWRMGGRFTLDYGRDNGLDLLLAGTPDIDPDVELGAFVEYYGGPWNFGGDVRHGVGLGDNSHGGFLAEMHGAYGVRFGRTRSLVVGLSSTFAGDGYMDAYFDTPGFNAKAGFRDVGGFVVLQQYFTPHVFGRIQIRGKRLLGDAAKSPVSDENSNNQFLLGTQAGYTF